MCEWLRSLMQSLTLAPVRTKQDADEQRRYLAYARRVRDLQVRQAALEAELGMMEHRRNE